MRSKHSGDAVDWLNYARSDLELARMNESSRVLLESLCFHAQQVAEKSLKAVLISCNIEFPRTHNLRTLLDIVPSDLAIPDEIEEGVILTDYAVASRYPGDFEPIEGEEYEDALYLAEIFLQWAEKVIREKTS